MQGKARNYGLDLCRAIAILLVVASHVLERVSGQPAAIPTFYLMTGMIGVELFFSLSGFLIGGILIDLAESGLSCRALGTFYLRRWLRTLPAYYVVLAALCLIYRKFDAPSFLFIQHFMPGAADLLPVSWSLAMEEYFYLLFPLLILAFLRSGLKAAVVAAALTLIVGMPLLRVVAMDWKLPFDDYSFHTHPLMRLDCCAYGVLAACARRRFGDRLRSFFRAVPPGAAFVLALTVVAAWMGLCLFMMDMQHWALLKWAYYWGTGYFALQSVLLDAPAALLVLYASYRPNPPHRLLDAPVRGLSRISYSLYLVNGNVMSLLLAYTPLGHRMGWAALIVPLASLGVAGLSYLLVEKPLLALRDRFVRDPARAAKEAARAAA